MADQSLYSPSKPHFFQPLLLGFRTHLNIPVAFFSKHLEGRNDQNKAATLRSDVSDKTWLVKMDGLKLTDGWEDFALAHDLRNGDIIVFRYGGEMVFHVTVLGPSCCEVQYTSSHNINDDRNDQTNIVSGNNRSRKKRVKKNRRSKVKSSSNHSQFVANVTASGLDHDQLYLPRSFVSSNGLVKGCTDHSSSDHSSFEANVSASNLTNDRLYLPKSFVRFNGLDKMSGEKIVLLNEENRSWEFNLTYYKESMQTYARPGWKRFCAANGMGLGQQYTCKLVKKYGPPVMRLYLKNKKNHFSRCRASSSYSQSQYVTLTLTQSALQTYKLFLPRDFTNVNGINKPGNITLLGQDGVKWEVNLFQEKIGKKMRFGKGWRKFCEAQGVKINESFVLELIWEEEASPMLKFCTKLNSA